MSAAKRPLLPSDATARKKSRATPYPPNALAALNAAESPLLRLPAELRNIIYEHVFRVNVIHVEREAKSALDAIWVYGTESHSQGRPAMIQAERREFFRFYLCEAKISEFAAYRRFRDAGLDERVNQEGDITSHVLDPNFWRVGDRFHVDSCKDRHEQCIPPPRPARWLEPCSQVRREGINLRTLLSLNLLQVCSQIHSEANTLPYSLNVFHFRQVSAFLQLLCSMPAAQAQSLKSLCFSMTAGHASIDDTTCSRWNSGLFTTPLYRLAGLRVLHISITISHRLMADDGPHRSDLANPSGLDGWVIGLERLRGLALDQVTVIVSDDPASKFGIKGAAEVQKYLLSHFSGAWMQMREAECFTADEKRQWAERIRGRLLMKKTAAS